MQLNKYSYILVPTLALVITMFTVPDFSLKSIFSLEESEWKILKNTICELFRIRTHQPIEPEIYVCNKGLKYPGGNQFGPQWYYCTWFYFWTVVGKKGLLKSITTLAFILFALYRVNSIYLWILCFSYRMLASNSIMNLVSTASIPILFLPLLFMETDFDVDQLFTIIYFNVLVDVPNKTLKQTTLAAYLATGSMQVFFFALIFGFVVNSLIKKLNSLLTYTCVDIFVRFCISDDVNQADFVVFHNENPNANALGQQQEDGDNQNFGDENTDITGLNLDVNIEIQMNRGQETENEEEQIPEIPENNNNLQIQENEENITPNMNEEEEYDEWDYEAGVINMNPVRTVEEFTKYNSQLRESVMVLVFLSVVSGVMLRFQNNRMKHITYMLLQFYLSPFLHSHKIFLMFYHDKVFYLWRHLFLDILLSVITYLASGFSINFFLIFPVFFSPIMPNISINKQELDKIVNQNN